MSSIFYRTDAKTGYVYAYESVSYRDPVTKRPRSKQTYLGRVDPITKEIRPKGEDGKRNRMKSGKQYDDLREQIAANQETIKEANEAIKALQSRLNKTEKFFGELKDMVKKYEEDFESDAGSPDAKGKGDAS